MSRDRGLTFVRVMRSLGISRGDIPSALAYASSQNWSNASDVVATLKAAVAPQTTTDGAGLATPGAFDFSEFLRPLTVLGRLPALRRMPARTRAISAVAGSNAYWGGEKGPRALTRLTFQGTVLEAWSVVAELVVTRELLISSDPAAENILARDLAASMVSEMDRAFLDPTNAGIPGVKPASISSGLTTVFHSSGNTLAAIDADLQLLIQALSDAGSTLENAVFILRPRTALFLSGLRGSGGALAYPMMTVKGGFLAGVATLVSAASHSDVGSPIHGGEVTLVDPSQILLVDDGNASLEISSEATIAMSDAPGSPATQTSMWQTNSSILKTTRYCNWMPVRPGMAQVLDSVMF